MIYALALLPIALVLALGHGLRRTGIIPEAGWATIERLTYYVLFPCLIVRSLSTSDFSDAPALGMAAALAGAQAVMLALALIGGRAVGASGPALTSLIQNCVRWNTFAGVALSGIIAGTHGLALAAIAVGTMVPVSNLVCVAALTRWGAPAAGAPKRGLVRGLVTNPLLIACAIGLGLQAGGLRPPAPIAEALDIPGRATLAMGLLAAGAGLSLAALRASGAAVLGWSLLRLILMPIVVAGLCALFDVHGAARTVALICAATPIATNSYILARSLGGDAPLMASLIAATTALAPVTMPAMLMLLA